MAGAGLAFAAAFGAVLLAEMGDKSQVLVMAQAARHPPWRVVGEAAAAFALLCVLAVTAGAGVARLLPGWALAGLAGALFLAFGAMALREARGRRSDQDAVAPRRGGTFALVVVSEFGDKTQLATAALAASTGQPVAVGAGAFLALVVSSALAALAGRWLGRRLGDQRRAWLSVWLFFALGAATLAWAAWRWWA